MKNVVLFFFLFCSCIGLCAQTTELVPNLKFGKPTNEELSMTTYAPDSSAAAVVLCKTLSAEYLWGTDDFRMAYKYKNKIKVLKDEGTAYADVCITYYEQKNNRLLRETVSGLEAYSYNLEDGKVVRTKMKKEQVFEERLNDYYIQIKFSIPQVKVGTVIEYEYEVQSDFYYNIREWKAQDDIPTLYTEYDIVFPEYFKFNLTMHGTEPLETKQEAENISFTIGGSVLQCNGNRHIFKGNKLPALKGDPYVWCTDNYCTQVGFELQSIEIPGLLYKSFTQSWENIDQRLLDDDSFGGLLKMSNPLKEETAALNLNGQGSTEEKIGLLFRLLKSHIKWNGKYALYGNKGKQVLKEGTGDNADLNFIFISMLKDAGIEAYPVVMSRRDRPMLPHSHPSIQRLNTFVVGIADTDSTMVFLDASAENGYIDILPAVLMTDRARVVIPGNRSLWLNLQQLGNNNLRTNINADIAPDGTVTGTRTISYNGQFAASLREGYRAAEDSTDYIRRICNSNGIEITSYSTKDLHSFSPTVTETLTFTKKSDSGDAMLYINPLIFAHTTDSPFKQAERKLPAEFPYLEKVNINVMLTLPEGYAVDELPQSTRLVTSDKSITGLYYVSQQGNKVSIRYSYSLNKLLFTNDDYPELNNSGKS